MTAAWVDITESDFTVLDHPRRCIQVGRVRIQHKEITAKAHRDVATFVIGTTQLSLASTAILPITANRIGVAGLAVKQQALCITCNLSPT